MEIFKHFVLLTLYILTNL